MELAAQGRGRGFRGTRASAKIELRKYATLAAYSDASGQDRHSVLVDYGVFLKVPHLNRNDLATVQRVYRAEDFDFRLKPGSAAVDKGIALPTVSARFKGSAPDLGAIEEGDSAPHYGPR